MFMPHNISQERKNLWMFLAGGYLYVGDNMVYEDLFYLKRLGSQERTAEILYLVIRT